MITPTDAILRILWAQIWQLALLVLIVGLVARFLCQRRPHLAYILWMVVLLKGLTPPLWSSPTSVFSWASRGPVIVASVGPADDTHQNSVARRAAEISAATQTVPERTSNVGELANPDQAVPAASAIQIPIRLSGSMFRWVSATKVPVILCMVWLAGMLIYACYAVLSVVNCRRVVRRRQVPVEEPLATLMARLSQHLEVKKQIRLRVVDDSVGPLTMGWVHPMIILPRALVQKSVKELEPILAHELIHVRRRDALVGMLQVVFQSLWWFHPLVWLANRHLCLERERCCDEEVIAEFGYEPSRYGRSLLGVLELKRPLWLPAAVPGIRPFEVTRRRLEYLAKYSKDFRNRMPRRYWLVLVLGLLLVAPGAGLSKPDKSDAARAADPASAKASALPEEWTVKGRVVDHRGKGIANAEVLLLGDERIFVDAGQRNWFVRRTEQGQLQKPLSTHTDNDGKFEITRTDGSPNRLAVISTDPLFWVVARDKIADSGKAEIKLPAPGSLAVDCDLPGKPAQQQLNIALRTFDGIDWNGDILMCRDQSYSVKNPGEAAFDHLPPGKYAVEREQNTRTGPNEMLVTHADRQLVDVLSDKRATVHFNRKVGRPLTGKVRGLENEDLRRAEVMIQYWGPEEAPLPDGRRSRQSTTFDVIPITSTGDFTTDPIPPGEYMLDLFAMRSTTSNQSPQQSDFEGREKFTVAEDGDMPKVEVEAKPRSVTPNDKAINPLRVLDDLGNPVPKFELKVWTSGMGNSAWIIGSNGQIEQKEPLWGFKNSEALDVSLRADGYASTLAHFAGESLEKLKRGEATLVMPRGQEVQVHFRLPDGLEWPNGYKPEIYFDTLSQDVRMLWQPSNKHAAANSDYNVFRLRAETPGVAILRLATDTSPFRVAIHSPGFLQFQEWGPFTLADVKHGKLEIDVPRPAVLDVQFDRGDVPADQLPFDAATIEVMWKIPGTASSYLSVTDSLGDSIDRHFRLADLSAGEYRVVLRTKAKSDVKDLPKKQDGSINPGVFFAVKKVTLEPGKSEQIDFRYMPLDANAFRGDRTAVVRIVKPDGSPAVGRKATIGYYDGHYGSLEVFSGGVPESGEITLTGITDRKAEGTSVDPYTVRVDNEQLGHFNLDSDSSKSEFTFRVPPTVGDMAPDIDLINLTSGATTKLSSLRGKVVCLEFWATWCGPCREPLQKLNELAAEERDAWQDQVALVPLSIDESSDVVTQTVARRGLTKLQPYWSKGDVPVVSGWEAPAARAFVVSGVPTTFIIDREGRIVWRGHPSDNRDGKDMTARIEAALKPDTH